MPTIGLPTFLYNDAADSLAKARRMAKYANEPGGGQYYWGVAEGAKKLFGEDLPFDAAVGVMENMKVGHQRTANQTALQALYQWKLKNPGKSLNAPKGLVYAPQHQLSVFLRPAFAWEFKGCKKAFVLWNYRNVRLSRGSAGMGIHLLEAELKNGFYSDWDFCMLDVAVTKTFGRSAISKDSAVAVEFALKHQEEMYVQAVKKAA